MAGLTATKVNVLKDPGRNGDGGGLYLVIRPSGTKAWVQRIVIDGRRRDIGIGAFPIVGQPREPLNNVAQVTYNSTWEL